MDMLKIHESALEGSIVPYHEFIYYLKTYKKRVYGFVEGKDDPSFYRGFIESCLPGDWDIKLIRAGGKDKVIEIFNMIDWSRIPMKCVCFFVDRDLSEFIGNINSGENIYITDNYSIENDLVTFNTIERVLEEIFGVIDLKPYEIGQIRSLFESNLAIFSEAMAPIMAQIILWRRAAVKVNLNEIRPKDYFDFNRGLIELRSEFSSPNIRLQHAASRVEAPKATEKDIAAAEEEFRNRDGIRKYIRGKYLLWFFIQSALEIPKVLPRICPRYKKEPNPVIGIGPKNAMVVIAGRARCPTTLKMFLERNFIAYINENSIAS